MDSISLGAVSQYNDPTVMARGRNFDYPHEEVDEGTGAAKCSQRATPKGFMHRDVRVLHGKRVEHRPDPTSV